MQNSQNNDIAIVYNILYYCTMIEIAQNSNCLYWYSDIGMLGTAGLVLLNHTSSAT